MNIARWAWPLLTLCPHLCAAETTPELPELPPLTVPEKAQSGEQNGPQVTFECLPQQLKMGDRLRCELKIEHQDDTSVSVNLPSNAELEIAGELKPQPLPGNRLLTTRSFTVFNPSMRDLRLKGVSVSWQRTDGQTGQIDLPEKRIPVLSILEGIENPEVKSFENPLGHQSKGGSDAEEKAKSADEFFDRHGPLSLQLTNWTLIIALFVLFGLALGAGIGFLIWRYVAAHRKPEAPYVDPRPAHVIAFERLERLAAKDLPGDGKVKEYYSQLSEIIRDYLQRRFKVSAMEMTSEEIRHSVRSLLQSAEARLGLDDFLNEAELVKFADFAPTTSAIDTIMRLARGLVELTKLKEAEESAVPENADGQPSGEAPNAEKSKPAPMVYIRTSAPEQSEKPEVSKAPESEPVKPSAEFFENDREPENSSDGSEVKLQSDPDPADDQNPDDEINVHSSDFQAEIEAEVQNSADDQGANGEFNPHSTDEFGQEALGGPHLTDEYAAVEDPIGHSTDEFTSPEAIKKISENVTGSYPIEKSQPEGDQGSEDARIAHTDSFNPPEAEPEPGLYGSIERSTQALREIRSEEPKSLQQRTAEDAKMGRMATPIANLMSSLLPADRNQTPVQGSPLKLNLGRTPLPTPLPRVPTGGKSLNRPLKPVLTAPIEHPTDDEVKP